MTDLSHLENQLIELKKVHGEIVRRFETLPNVTAFKFKDGAVYRVALERKFNKATLD